MEKSLTTKLKPPLQWSLGHIKNLLNIVEPRLNSLTQSEVSDYHRAKGYWEAQDGES